MENKIWILHRGFVEGFLHHTTQEISDYLKESNINVEIYNYRAMKFCIENGEEVLYYQNEKITELPKVAFARGNCYKLMHFLHNKGVTIINGFMNMVHMKDKWQTYLNLKQQNILQPLTLNANLPIPYSEVVEKLGEPFILKYRFGAQGKSVYLIESEEQYLDTIKKFYFDDLILQQYISTSFGKDIRVFVVGDQVFGAVRDNSNNDFRANLAQGGITYKFDIPERLMPVIKTICNTIDAEIVGLDFLFDNDDFTFCEANGNAGYKAFIAQNIDMSKIIADYICDKYFNEVDNGIKSN